jgi:hypothetical protein
MCLLAVSSGGLKITASLHHCITASLHHCITASLHHCITASRHYSRTELETDRPTVIRSKAGQDRTCRFCRKTASEGATFGSVAHAIPTALGNDHLKLADECDDCNHYFGTTTEPSLIAMLDVQRAFLGIQGRGKNDGRPKLYFAEGKVFHDGRKVNVEKAISKDDATDVISIRLGRGRRWCPPTHIGRWSRSCSLSSMRTSFRISPGRSNGCERENTAIGLCRPSRPRSLSSDVRTRQSRSGHLCEPGRGNGRR